MDRKISSDMPLPTPRSVMSSPSHMMTIVPVVMVMISSRIGPQVVVTAGHRVGRSTAEQRAGAGHEARVVAFSRPRAMVRYRVYWVSLDWPGCTLLLQLLEARDDHAQQLDDDRRGDVRHDAQGEDGDLQHRAAREHVDERVQPAGGVALGQADLHGAVVHPGAGTKAPSR